MAALEEKSAAAATAAQSSSEKSAAEKSAAVGDAEAVTALLAHARGNMSDGIRDLGGAVLDLQGGTYLLSQPLAIPQYVGNLRVIDGTLRASPAFPPAEFVLTIGGGVCAPHARRRPVVD